MNKNKYLLKNSAIFAIGNIGTKLINFFLVPYYTYVLSSEQYGTVDLLFTVCSLIIPVVMCNINEAVCDSSWIKMAVTTKLDRLQCVL